MSQPHNLNLLNILPSMAGARKMNPVEMRSFRPGSGNPGGENFESRFQKTLKTIDAQKPVQPVRKQQKPETNKYHEENKHLDESSEKVKRDLEQTIQYLEDLLYGGQVQSGDIIARLEKITETLSQLKKGGPGENVILENFQAKLMEMLGFDGEKQNALSSRVEAFVKELHDLVSGLQKQDGHNKPVQSPVLSEGLRQLLVNNSNTAESPGSEGPSKDGALRILQDGDSMQHQSGENAEGKNEGKLFDYLFNPQHDAAQNTAQQGFWQGGLSLAQSAEQAGQSLETANTSRWDDRTLQILKQVTAVITGTLKNGVREIQVQLVPEHLGKVQINIEMKNDVMTGRLTVENETVKQAVESNLQHLREALEGQNIKLDSLEVAVNQDRRFWFARGGDPGQDRGLNGRTRGDKEADEGNAEEEILYEGGDTGRRLGYNTLELVA